MQPLARRRIWLAGIGGAGMSGYAVLAHAWGADVSGWDRVETPYLEHVRAAGIPVTVTPEPPQPPAGAEAYVSTAYAGRVPGRARAELVAELASLREAIVVTGAHGKTTTAGMIAFVLDRLDRDPAFLLGGELPQLGANARAGEGWLVVEGDESDRTVFSLPAAIAVVTNVELDHHAEFASEAELALELERWAATVPTVVRGWELEPADVPLAVPGEHNRRNAACALAALEAAGVARAEAERALADFRGAHRRFEAHGEAGGVRLFDDYAHHPTEVAAALATARGEAGQGRVLVLFQPHLYTRTLHLKRELAAALQAADLACVTEIYPAREEPLPDVSGRLVVEQLAELVPGRRVGWAPTTAAAADLLAAHARAGDLILTVGAGDVDAVLPRLRERLAG